MTIVMTNTTVSGISIGITGNIAPETNSCNISRVKKLHRRLGNLCTVNCWVYNVEGIDSYIEGVQLCRKTFTVKWRISSTFDLLFAFP